MSQAKSKDIPFKPKRGEYARDVTKYDRQLQRTESGWKSHLFSDSCIQVTAWLLFTVGLCVIICAIYVGIVIRSSDDENNDNDNSLDFGYISEGTTTVRVKSTTPYIMLNKSVRALNLLGTGEAYKAGCREFNCKITCIQAESVYEIIYNTFVNTCCTGIDVLLIKEQRFPLDMLRNAWIDGYRPIYELVITSSNIMRIRSGAFNSPLFAHTYQLTLSDLQLKRIGGGALLGMKSLRYLIIITPLKQINRAFFQPIQSTLLHLRMNCGLNVPPGQTVFGVSTLSKLEYADLSNNVFNGPLTRKMFRATPNLRYLHISNSRITAIENDAFEELKDSLQVVDLSGNFLTTISISTLNPLLMGRGNVLLSLAYNRWNCECNLQGFASVYQRFYKQFLGTIYCHSPYWHYGDLLIDVNFQYEGCALETTNFVETSGESAARTTAITIKPSEVSEVPMPKTNTTTTKPPTTALARTSSNADMEITTYASSNNSGALPSLPYGSSSSSRSSGEDSNVIQMRCLQGTAESSSELRSAKDKRSIEIQIHSPESVDTQEDAPELSNSSEESIESEESDEIQVHPYTTPWKPVTTTWKDDITSTIPSSTTFNRESRNPATTYYKFEIPPYTLELTLLSNKSVKVVIRDYNSQPEINIIWFSRQNVAAHVVDDNAAAQNIDYHCEFYQEPYLIAKDLHLNCTYTFCMLPPQHTISPFNCFPMHVPLAKDDSDTTWITNDEKQFTISMLFTIFTLSIFFGGVIAYFGIKTYPELLEGSKNVLVVKRSESESDYLKSMGSIKKEPLSRRSTKKLSSSLPETPPESLPPPPPFSVSTFKLECLSSVKSSSTFFESSFGPPPFAVVDDQYELPMQHNGISDGERCVPNPYATSPCSPPPLPKRNHSITSSIIANRFTKAD